MELSPERVVEDYKEWLFENLQVRSFEGGVEVTTPFVDRHNDFLQVYAFAEDGTVTLSDGGHTVRDLALNGTELNTPKRKRVVQTILNKGSVDLEDDALIARVNGGQIGSRLQALIQAILAVNDMYVLAQPTVAQLFEEDVRVFFDQHEVEYEQGFRLPGRSGYEHQFDFLIPPLDGGPSRLVEAIDSPSKDKVDRFLWALTDTETSRPDTTKPYAFLNDVGAEIDTSLVEALQSYAVTPMPWSERQSIISDFISR